MAEFNKVTVFSDESGNPKEGLVDSQRRVVVSLGGAGAIPSIPYPGSTGTIGGNTETEVVSVTVGAGKKFYLTGLHGTGTADCCFRLYKNSTKLYTLRNSSAQRDVEKSWQMHPFEFAEGDVVKLTAEHKRTDTQSFEGVLEGYDVTV
jgi:hypothetical protein